MRKDFIGLMIILISLLYPASSLAEVTAKESLSGKNTLVTFYDNNEEIAKEIWYNIKLLSHEGNIPDGIINRYNTENQLVGKTEYKNNLPAGLYINYNSNGNILLQGYYSNTSFTPELYKAYHENGNLRLEENYTNGKLEGVVKNYSENGNIISEKYYKASLLDGLSKEYYENNTIKSVESYKEGWLNGVSKLYNEKGVLIEESTYSSNKLNGPQNIYYANGKIHYKRMYYLSNLVSEDIYYKDGTLKSSKYNPANAPQDQKLYYDPDDEEPMYKRSSIFK